jgi:hypothetical protein
MHSDWFHRAEIVQGRWQHGEEVGHWYPCTLENTICNWDIYVPRVMKGISNLIIKANEMHYFSNLFHKVLYMFRTSPLSIVRSNSTLYTRNWSCWRLLADANRTSTTNTYCCVYSVEILLTMDSGPVRNM